MYQSDITIVVGATAASPALLDGLNAFLAEQKTLRPKTRLTLIQRAGPGYETTYTGSLHEAPTAVASAPPTGIVPWCDAILRIIDETGDRLRALPVVHRPDRVLLALVTDGDDTVSSESVRRALADQITRQQTVYSWIVQYFSAATYAVQDAAAYAIPATMAAVYQPDRLKDVFQVISAAVGRVRLGAAAAIGSHERERMLGASQQYRYRV